MLSPTKLRENKIHAEAARARQKAGINQVYVYKGNDEYEFIDPGGLSVGDMELGLKLYSIEEWLCRLEKLVQENETDIKLLYAKIAELENGKFRLMKFRSEEEK